MLKSTKILALAYLMLFSVNGLAQQGALQNSATKSVSIPVLSGNVTINGVLDEDTWSQAVLIEDLHQVFPEEYVSPSQPTQVRVFYTENALYIGALMLESDADQITDRVLRQGQSLSSDDVFAVILDPYLDRRNGYRFEVNPNGVRWEGLFQNIIEVEGNWQGVWEARAQRNAEGWSAEIRIPFQSLSFNPGSTTWGLNFNRIRRNSNENIAWSSYNREVNPSTSGIATGLENLRQGVGLDVVPSMTLRRNRKFGPGGFEENNFEPQLDVFYKVTPQLNASLTLNTDFSATEVDDRQVNLTRFNLFFPEKRDFFLRDVDIFEFGQIGSGNFNSTSGTGSSAISTPARQSARPFFSRKIGLGSNGEPVDIIGGVKLSGRVGDWNVGTLVINQDETETIDAQNIFVGRTVLNVGSRTQVGAIMTDGNPQSNADNTLVGTDVRYRNTSFYGNTIEMSAFYQETDTEGVANQDNASYGLNFFLPNAQGWQGLYQYKRVEENFFPAVGFVNNTDVEVHHANAGYRHFLAPNSFFRSIALLAEGYREENLDDGSLNTENLDLRLTSFTNTNDSYWTRYNYYKELLQQPFTIYRASDGSGTITIPAGEYSWNEYFMGFQWGGQRKLSGSLQLQGGDYYDGTHFQKNGNVTWRPNRNFSLRFSFTENRIELPGGNFTLRLFGLNSQYAFSSTLSWSNLIQYDNISENMGLNSRLHWIPKAGQQVFLVLNWGLIDADKDNHFDSTVADLSLKFNYTFRF
ncbi:MAG: carbohydrate binding family 9 domain-containing protein [Gammaproteobacteria bacterium]|nr:carbohydrate binding family 9 domain-containing protein [Gammaproteobacteria bacterium]